MWFSGLSCWRWLSLFTPRRAMAGSQWVWRSCCGPIRRGGQQWFSLSDPGMEEAFHESPVLRRFAGVDLGVAAAPDETTMLRFRHLLEAHDLCGEMPAIKGRPRRSMRPRPRHRT